MANTVCNCNPCKVYFLILTPISISTNTPTDRLCHTGSIADTLMPRTPVSTYTQITPNPSKPVFKPCPSFCNPLRPHLHLLHPLYLPYPSHPCILTYACI